MAYSIIGGLINNDFPPSLITAIDPNADQLAKLKDNFAINTHTHIEATIAADCVVLAVKPQVMRTVIDQYRDYFELEKTLFVSIAAGISIASLSKWLSATTPIVRCMPNTPALVQSGATVLTANSYASQAFKEMADNILSAVGICHWTDDENLMHAVTATSGSGPAYFFLLMEQMQLTAEKLGLDKEQAKQLVVQTALGAAKMAQANATSFTTLRENVTSKGGTTAAALNVFAEKQFNESVKLALQAAADRSLDMQNEFDQEIKG